MCPMENLFGKELNKKIQMDSIHLNFFFVIFSV